MNQLEQLSLYDYFSKDQDPLYLKISKIQEGESVKLGEFDVTLNKFGIYEIKTKYTHEAKRTLEECYEYINATCKNKEMDR